jgi:hypothetical protein
LHGNLTALLRFRSQQLAERARMSCSLLRMPLIQPPKGRGIAPRNPRVPGLG